MDFCFQNLSLEYTFLNEKILGTISINILHQIVFFGFGIRQHFLPVYQIV